VKPIDYITSAFLGTSRARSEHAKAMALSPSVRLGVAELKGLCPDEATNDGASPIFLLSAGWRSGSTLLQRLVMSDPRVLLWGEPFDECGVIQAMAGTVKPFRTGWPPRDYYLSHHDGAKPGELADDWIANLFPAVADLRRGYRAFFEATFAEPARRAGASRWGLKEVRLTAEHAHYLKWLYPSARFIFLYRNPLDAYQSYCRYGRNWYDRWPDKPVFTPTSFGRHWRALTEGFLKDEQALGAFVVRYEDLIDGTEELLHRIERYLDVRLDRSVLGMKIGSSERGGRQAPVSLLEKSLLRAAVSPCAQALGYRW
jgi:hypothetical protein